MQSNMQIIPFYAHPHVHTAIFDNTWYDETNLTSGDDADLPFSTCVVTAADMGVDNMFVRLNDIRTKQALFGRGNYIKYGQSSIQADVLFNGNTNVWFMRVLPENATYSNMIMMAYFREGNILDELNQETGLKRLEVKFSMENATPDFLDSTALTDSDIDELAVKLTNLTPDPLTGYMSIPLFYVRSTGRGRYGNNYSLRVIRDVEAEREYGIKMFRYTLLNNTTVTRVSNMFSGSMHQTTRHDMSTLIDDVLDHFPAGSAPIFIKTYEGNFNHVFDFYQRIVRKNREYLEASGTPEELRELQFAEGITVDTFDLLFGFRLNTRNNQLIPYYRNYTIDLANPYTVPDLVIPEGSDVQRPLNVDAWNTVFAGATLLMIADPLNEGKRWLYTVVSVDFETGNIVYNEGVEVAIDADQYDGMDIQLPTGHMFNGGHDGDFQEITVGGVTRPPTEAEMKILLSREFVKAFRGEKDRKILSPSRMSLDFIFDANYNMTNDGEQLLMDTHMAPLFTNSTILTDKDAQELATVGSNMVIDYQDINVKRAMWDLNEFRNRNGMTINPAEGAGCLLHLDSNLIGLRESSIHSDILDLIDMMEDFGGRNTSIDVGYYDIFDPMTVKRVPVTVMYHIAENLVPHIMSQGLNKPFTYTHASLRATTRNSRARITTGTFIRDSFQPDIDLIDWDVKERLHFSRINYWLTADEGRLVQRASQNTRQIDPSALLEENNVRVLNALKKGLERACKSYLYEWNEPEVRRGYTEGQTEIYRPWIGTMVQDLRIFFTANEWEQNRMIMRCWVEVAFRDITKRIIVEINISRPNDFGQMEEGVTVGQTISNTGGGVV